MRPQSESGYETKTLRFILPRASSWILLRSTTACPVSRGSRAVYQIKDLIFVAKVKNGFVPRLRDELFPALKTLRTARCLFANLPEKRASRWGESLTAEKMDECHWVKPKLVCQVAFVE
jgi:hypothetical protein